jgi:predicted anti-sigma-YlaC factor YlaD
MTPFPFPPCKEVHESLTELMEGSAPLYKRLLLRLHLAFCEACRPAFLAFLAMRRVGPKLLVPPTEPPPEAEDALKTVLQQVKQGRVETETKG